MIRMQERQKCLAGCVSNIYLPYSLSLELQLYVLFQEEEDFFLKCLLTCLARMVVVYWRDS